jgi:hypothetical protein
VSIADNAHSLAAQFPVAIVRRPTDIPSPLPEIAIDFRHINLPFKQVEQDVFGNGRFVLIGVAEPAAGRELAFTHPVTSGERDLIQAKLQPWRPTAEQITTNQCIGSRQHGQKVFAVVNIRTPRQHSPWPFKTGLDALALGDGVVAGEEQG